MNKSLWEQNAEIVSGHVSEQVSEHVLLLLQFGTFSGFEAIVLTANALCSLVRKENPASRACGKKLILEQNGEIEGNWKCGSFRM